MPQFKASEKRIRPPVSCEPCRTRKLKCDRGSPCDTCTRREKSCHYASNARRGQITKTQQLKDRLGDLERMVVTLSNQVSSNISASKEKPVLVPQQQDIDRHVDTTSSLVNSTNSEPVTTAFEAQPATESPSLQVTAQGQLNYLEPNHWQSILKQISDVKDGLSDSDALLPEDHLETSLSSSALDVAPLINSGRNDSVDFCLASLPPRTTCDLLVSFYFNLPSMVLAFVHPVEFQKDYESFWQSPATIQPLWLALLFAIIGIATSLRKLTHPSDELLKSVSLANLQETTLQCLVVGNYISANAFALEAFLLHLQSLFIGKSSNSTTTWFEMGTILRLAFRMGYHRDPDKLPGISVFAGEMRRRLWINLVQIEALLSYQTGFPSMIQADFCDTKPPRNLHYSDLSLEMLSLPSSRPISETTLVSYSLIKENIMKVFKKIVQHTQSLVDVSYDKTITLDSEMRQTYASLLPSHQRRDISSSLLDSSTLIFERCTIEGLYCKGLMVLHRKWLIYDGTQSRAFEFSRNACLDAALELLARFIDLYKSCEPGGRLHAERGMFYAFPPWDFLLATMIVNLDLSKNTASHRGQIEQQRYLTKIETMTQVQLGWTNLAKDSPHARVAAVTTSTLLANLQERDSAALNTASNDETALGNIELPFDDTFAQFFQDAEPVEWSMLDHCFLELDDASSMLYH